MIAFLSRNNIIFSILMIAGFLQGHDDWQTSPYFNTQFLHAYDKVKASLITDGFREVAFKSIDGYNIQGLYRSQPNASSNVILAAGFFPGRKEGMATFIQLLPADCNILLLDARGHGDSDGPFWRTIMWYGQDEFKDIIGALNFVCDDNNLPNLLLGVCIGAFHCARAALFLEKRDLIDAYNLHGIVFDSGFGSIADLKWIPSTHITQKTLPHLCRSWIYTNEDKDSIKDRLAYRIGSTITYHCTNIATYVVAPFLNSAEEQTNLFDKINTIQVPILYIHCKNDTYTPFNDVVKLAERTRHSSHWWIDQSEHACHHLKYKKEYRDCLLEFINKTIHT